jgi:hypothetical protein
MFYHRLFRDEFISHELIHPDYIRQYEFKRLFQLLKKQWSITAILKKYCIFANDWNSAFCYLYYDNDIHGVVVDDYDDDMDK